MVIKESRINERIEWTIDDPKNGNSLGLRVYERFDELLSFLEGECQRIIFTAQSGRPPARLLVIRSKKAGRQENPIWIAGGNLKELADFDPHAARAYAQKYSLLCRRLMSLPIPVLFAMDGQVIGGGVELALFGDVRFATSSTSFAFKQLKLGLSMGYCSSSRLSELVGPATAMDYLLSQKVVSSKELLAKGLIQKEVLGVQELDRAVERFGAKLAQLEPLAVAMQKRMLYRNYLSRTDHIEGDLDDFTSLWKNPTHKRFLNGFLNGKQSDET